MILKPCDDWMSVIALPKYARSTKIVYSSAIRVAFHIVKHVVEQALVFELNVRYWINLFFFFIPSISFIFCQFGFFFCSFFFSEIFCALNVIGFRVRHFFFSSIFGIKLNSEVIVVKYSFEFITNLWTIDHPVSFSNWL